MSRAVDQAGGHAAQPADRPRADRCGSRGGRPPGDRAHRERREQPADRPQPPSGTGDSARAGTRVVPTTKAVRAASSRTKEYGDAAATSRAGPTGAEGERHTDHREHRGERQEDHLPCGRRAPPGREDEQHQHTAEPAPRREGVAATSLAVGSLMPASRRARSTGPTRGASTVSSTSAHTASIRSSSTRRIARQLGQASRCCSTDAARTGRPGRTCTCRRVLARGASWSCELLPQGVSGAHHAGLHGAGAQPEQLCRPRGWSGRRGRWPGRRRGAPARGRPARLPGHRARPRAGRAPPRTPRGTGPAPRSGRPPAAACAGRRPACGRRCPTSRPPALPFRVLPGALPDRDERVLQRVVDHCGVSAPAGEPGGQPRHVTAVEDLERARAARRDVRDQLLVAPRVGHCSAPGPTGLTLPESARFTSRHTSAAARGEPEPGRVRRLHRPLAVQQERPRGAARRELPLDRRTAPGVAASVAVQRHVDLVARGEGRVALEREDVLVVRPGGDRVLAAGRLMGVHGVPRAGLEAGEGDLDVRVALGVLDGRCREAGAVADLGCPRDQGTGVAERPPPRRSRRSRRTGRRQQQLRSW